MADDIKANGSTSQENGQEKALSVIDIDVASLNEESKALINKIIAEVDINKTKDLTYLFNVNQNKKTMVRVNKLNELLDVITDQAVVRFTSRPDEISNKELIDSLKTIQDLIERGQKQVSGVTETPLIQINQQTNEVNVGDTTKTLSRDSRERVKNAVLSLLNGLNVQTVQDNQIIEEAELVDDSDDGGDE